jgi:hypothetical protein
MPLAEDLALLAAWAAGSVPGKAARKRTFVRAPRMGARAHEGLWTWGAGRANGGKASPIKMGSSALSIWVCMARIMEKAKHDV